MIGKANCLTFIRLFVTPIFMILYLNHNFFSISSIVLPYILLIIFGFLELSDAVDGFLARKYAEVTDLGKVLDPMADSVYHISVFLTFTRPPVDLPLILVFIFIYRDSVISTLRTLCALNGIALGARSSGKIKSVLQAISSLAVLLMMIPYSLGYCAQDSLRYTAIIGIGLAALYSVASGLEYLIVNRKYLILMINTTSASKNKKH
ncbi:CDP-diacylglycerol--glycerol-3-phosphate 3-phosphatidyltransferase [Candidatus Clavichlamydia salmonicola]|uniref:CDP-diacylglycerol--glycerol-3-phosphate 3-phosphatidyltransferase n=1 Tax=Candidatus Clavichlamydia salmonicola TaxID=469812 RepID=UPI001E3F5378|nr:CDP-diacylglycerol--glycerol-3-phosphate 3-phosphatidyltransferase [Candidatus Clavichlamydia salmonicola]